MGNRKRKMNERSNSLRPIGIAKLRSAPVDWPAAEKKNKTKSKKKTNKTKQNDERKTKKQKKNK